MPGNTRSGRLGDRATETDRQRLFEPGKGEKVVQETTGAAGNRCGQATPIGSKAKQEGQGTTRSRLLRERTSG